MIRTFASLMMVVVAASACHRDERAPASSEPVPASGSAPPAVAPPAVAPPVAVDAAVPVDAEAPDAQTLKEHMFEHFSAVSDLQRAIARGHLDEAKRLATWLAEHDEHLLDGWQPYVDELRTAAREVAAATDLPTAGSVAARLGRACSRCHEARTAIVSFVWEPAPEADATLPTQMKRHQWAAARLWDGLVGPSDVLWREGAEVLATTQLDAVKAAGGDAGRGDIAALGRRIRELATQATKLTDHDKRAALYGQLLSTCAGCHALVRPKPVPGP